MYKPGFIVSFILLVATGCGGGAMQAATTPPGIDLDADSRLSAAVDEAFEAYQRELHEAANDTYPSRQAAEAHATTLGHESRLLYHIRHSLKQRGLQVQDLCLHVAAHPGFADRQREARADQLDLFDDLVDAIATEAPVASDPYPEDATQLADGSSINRNARSLGGNR